MQIYYAIIFFIFGIVFGSFFNVVSYRLPKEMSLIKPRSHCPKCKKILKPIDLIPIFSYIFNGGKCKYCKKKISIFYPIIEFITGLIFVLCYLRFGLTINTAIALVFSSIMIITILSDILYMIVCDEVLIVGGILLFILEIIKNGFNYIPTLLLDMAISFVFIYLLKLLGNFMFKKESLGGGDIKLMILFGIVIGYEMTMFSVVLASFIALPISIIILLRKKEHELPFVPYLGIAALICLFTKIDITYIFNLLGF